MSPTSPRFSVIMPTFRMGPFIGEALRSVARQTEKDWEVVVVDDAGPPDGTAEAVREFAQRHPEHRVEYIRHEKNTGVSGARNTAIEAARGEWLSFLDPDDLWMPTHLEAAAKTAEAHPGTEAVGSPVIYFNEQTEARVDLEEWQVQAFPASLALNNFLQPSSTLAKRKVVNKVGGFDTDPALQHIEDYDLWIRLVEAGCRFCFQKTPLVRYRKHGQAATHNEKRIRELDAALVRKHAEFFARSQRQLIWGLYARNQFLLDALRRPWRTVWAKIKKCAGLGRSTPPA